MKLWRWLSGLFRREPRLMDELPEVLGYVTDDQGQQQSLHRGWLKHESLSQDQLQRIGRLRDVLIDAYPMTLDGWVDGFMRDAHPESEIQIIEACATVYQELSKQVHLSRDEKGRLYAVVCAISSGAEGPQLAAALPTGKGLPTLAEVINMYCEARQSGSRP
jgi:hypothetical protein